MKELITPFKNWRVLVLTALGALDALLLLSEASDGTGMAAFLLVKAAGFSIAYGIYRLGKYWDSKGKINELMALADEED